MQGAETPGLSLSPTFSQDIPDDCLIPDPPPSPPPIFLEPCHLQSELEEAEASNSETFLKRNINMRAGDSTSSVDVRDVADHPLLSVDVSQVTMVTVQHLFQWVHLC